MTAEAMRITELTGSRRFVELRDRTLPYRPVAWPGEQRHVQRWYPGNPVATIQVLGPSEMNTDLKGMWKTRYIAEMVGLDGFDDLVGPGDPVTAEVLTQVFHRLRISGNLLEVSWGPEVRRGILFSFEANYQRVEDIEWSATFVWNQKGERAAPRVAVAENPTSQLETGMAELDASLAQRPPFILPNVTTALFVVEAAIRLANSVMLSSLQSIFGVPEIGLEQFRGIASETEQIVANVAALRELLSDTSIEGLIANDDVGSVLETDRWRGDVTADAIALAVAAIEARESVRGKVIADFLGSDRVRQGETLRSVASRWYGEADAWPTIADANGLVGSVQPVGTFVFIPRRSNAGTGAAA